MKNKLVIKGLHAKELKSGQKILKGIDLTIKSGEIHAIMGPNGSGKSTLCYALMGHPNYKITKGSVTFNGKNILKLSVDKRARLGMFLGFQYPHEVPGVSFGNFMRNVVNTRTDNLILPVEFHSLIKKEILNVKMDQKFIDRSLNDGFSGGEKKRAEIAQMALIKPKIAILDEIDSGLDIDALKVVSKRIKQIYEKLNMGVLLITHYQRILEHLTPHFVHIMSNGKIIKSGDRELARILERDGYESFVKVKT
jgi:Fe-S cluster assembly ATP-binding protein